MTDFDNTTDSFDGSPDDSKQPSATAISRRLAPGGGGGGAWLGGPKTASSEKFGNDGKKNFHLLGTDLFGDEIKADAKGKLREKFDFPPFTILNAREGAWQERKRAWLACGIQSEVGRGENLLKMSDTLLEPDPEKRAAMQAARQLPETSSLKGGLTYGMSIHPYDAVGQRRNEEARTYGSGGPGDLAAGFRRQETASLSGGLVLGTTTDPYRSPGEAVEGSGGTGTSIFDPVLTELCYRWFCPPGGLILDPFAGGSVRGIVAGLLGFRYHGIDLRPEQIEANEVQRAMIAPEADIQWAVGDSNKLLPEAPEADFVFSCPPYGDLEQYSDDPADLSNMTWNQFVALYMSIIKKACARLKNNRFACFVVGEYRDKETGLYRGFVPLTCAAFMKENISLYNEAILVTAVGSLPIRVTKQFETSRKLGKTHQNVLVFCKGDPRLAAEAVRGDGSSEALYTPLASGPPLSLWPAPRPGQAGGQGMEAAPQGAGQGVPGPFGPAGAGGSLGEVLTLSSSTLSAPSQGSLADFLSSAPASTNANWRPDEPPILDGIDTIVLNFATTGTNWAKGDRPIGLTVSTLDGKLTRFLPFAFNGGGNLDEAVIKRWYQEQVKNKHIVNAHTAFEVHMSRVWGVDLEEQNCTVSDVMHYAALLDDHRRRFGLDILVKDFLPLEPVTARVDETQHADYAAWQVADREYYTARVTAKLRNAMWPQLDAQDLQEVRQLEDEVIYPVVEMEKNGSKLNVELLEDMFKACTTRHGQLMLELSQEVGFPVEISATGWQRLFEYCGLTPSNSYAEHVVGVIDHPIIKKAYFAGQLASLNSKCFAAYKQNIDAEGVLRYEINQLRGDEGGTVSGRFSFGYLQQTPNHDNHHAVFGTGDVETCGGLCDLFPRRLVVPAIGDYLEADAAQIEYRLFAHFANNAEVLQGYHDDPWMSFHKKTWAMFKQYKPNMLYSHQKNLNFAKQYGARTIKLATMMGFITAAEGEEIRRAKRWNDPKLKEAQEIESIFKRVMPEGDELLERASHLAKTACDEYCKVGDKLHREYPHRGWVKTIDGRRSRFPNNYKTYIALNRVLQGSGAGIMKRKLVELHKERKETGFLMRVTLHDAVGGDAQGGQETKQKVAEILNRQSFPQLKVPILWETKLGPSWAECK